MLAWKPTRDLAPGEFRNGLSILVVGLVTSLFLAGIAGLPQTLRRVPTAGEHPPSDAGPPGFLVALGLSFLTLAANALITAAMTAQPK